MIINILIPLILLCGFFVVHSKNPIYSVLNLILTFILSALLILNVGAEFLAMSFIIIYVGAIAVLFLFIVMMLDIKIKNDKIETFFYGPLGYFILFIFLLEITLPLTETMCNLPYFENINNLYFYLSWFESYDELTNIERIGQLLYTYFYVYFLMAGFILFIGIIGALMLTLNPTRAKNYKQNLTNQISRNRSNAFLIYRRK